MLHFARLAMHKLWRTHHIAAESCANRLMPKADAKNRNLAGKTPHHIDRDARILRRAGPRREKNPLRSQRLHLVRGQLIVAAHRHLRAKLAHVLHQVVSERIVIVENKDHETDFSVPRSRQESSLHIKIVACGLSLYRSQGKYP